MKNLYLEHKEKTQKEVEDFPMAFAFSDEQLEKALEKLNATIDDVISIGAGGIIRKSDLQAYKELADKIERTHKENLKNETYVYQMFRYELANHEYCITEDLTDTLEACNLTEEEIRNNPMWLKMLAKARTEYLENVVW